jgi:hypothetical protein
MGNPVVFSELPASGSVHNCDSGIRAVSGFMAQIVEMMRQFGPEVTLATCLSPLALLVIIQVLTGRGLPD